MWDAIHRHEILVAIHHQFEHPQRVSRVDDTPSRISGRFQKWDTGFPIVTEVMAPVADGRARGPECLKRFPE